MKKIWKKSNSEMEKTVIIIILYVLMTAANLITVLTAVIYSAALLNSLTDIL